MPTPSASGLDSLPVIEGMTALRAALDKGHALLTAEPGSGKTTLVPLLLLDADWLRGRRIVMLEPRRPAARMAAHRMARLCNEPVGQTVGYQVRFERRISPATRIEVLTEGLLLRRLQADPELDGIGLVIFDEFHERHLQADLSLALCLDVARGLRDDLRLLVMSATLETEPLCRLLPATAVSVPGRVHPVEVLYDARDASAEDLTEACLRLTGRAVDETSGDVLVFLPGRREIERFLSALDSHRLAPRVEGLPLHGQLERRAQDRVLQGPRQGLRRVIAATDIAETSLTIEGVTAVVDSGFARRPVFMPATGLTRLATQRISRASADQRAGRAGRLGPGHAYRAWTPQRHARLAAQGRPEIAAADLASIALEIAAWGARVDDLAWLDPPPEAAWRQALALLRDLDAVQDSGLVNAQGRRMARLPAHPRLAHLLVKAAGQADRSLAADIAALLSGPDPLRGEQRRRAGADLAVRLQILEAFRRDPGALAGEHAAVRRIDQVASQFRALCPSGERDAVAALTLGSALLLAYPDRVARRSPGDDRRYLLRSGRAATLGADDPLRGALYLVAASVDAGDRQGRIQLAAAVTAGEIEAACGDRIEDRREVRWDEALQDVVARRVRRLGAMVLREEQDGLRPDDPVFACIAERAHALGLERLFDLPAELCARVEHMRRLEPDDWPDFSVPGLDAALDVWLLPWLVPGSGLRALRRTGVDTLLRHYLGRQRLQRLDAALPQHIETPAGTRRRIQYASDADPVLALPVQELFGMRSGPRLAEGRVPLVYHLLSPAGRPLQITSDLAAFWTGAYDDVKKEMRGRYPKHHWPDDPATSPASRSLKRR